MRNIAAVKPCSMFRLTIPLVAGTFCIRSVFFQGALPVLVSGTGILGVLDWLDCIGEMARLPFSRWLFGGMAFYVSTFVYGALLVQLKMATGGL